MLRLSRPLLTVFFAVASVATCWATSLPWDETNDFIVSDAGNDRLAVYSAEGVLRNHMNLDGLDHPSGIAMRSEGGFFVGSFHSNEIFAVDADGTVTSRFGHDSLVGPSELAIGPNGLLYVTGYRSDQIAVFDASGNFLRSFSGGQMNRPSGIAFDSMGNIHVASAAAILKFDAAENFVDSFMVTQGTYLPRGIARDENDTLFIPEVVSGTYDHRIVMMDTDGGFVGELKHEDLFFPFGVAFDGRGHLFVATHLGGVNLVEFDTNGGYVQTMDLEELRPFREVPFAFFPGPYSSVDLACDFNADGLCNISDIDLLTANIGGPLTFDLNGNGAVDISDVVEWNELASNPENRFAGNRKFMIGDVDLSGTVNSWDLGILLNNFGASVGSKYSEGDIDGSGKVDSYDLAVQLNNFGFSSNVTTTVPEPAGDIMIMLFIVGGVVALRRIRE